MLVFSELEPDARGEGQSWVSCLALARARALRPRALLRRYSQTALLKGRSSYYSYSIKAKANTPPQTVVCNQQVCKVHEHEHKHE